MEFLGSCLAKMGAFNSICELWKNVREGTSTRLGYVSRFDENMQSLKRKREDLIRQEGDIKDELAKEELHSGKRRKKEIDNWLTKVEQIKVDVQGLEGEVVGKRAYISRAKLGKRIVEKIEEVAELLQEKGRFSSPLVLDAVLNMKQEIPTSSFFSSTTIERNMNKVWERLMDDEVRRIGIYGMGGVGKTTIMKNIYNRLVKVPKFEHVIWVTVSKAFNVEKLQSQIAEAIKLDLSNCSDETARASNLLAKLSKMKSYVLFFDDLWESFPLDKVGLAAEPTGSNGYKLVITTRSLKVCQKMECNPIKVKLLTEEEGLNLFMYTLGHSTVLAPEVEEIAKEVAKECKCLPLAIITVARSMRGESDIRVWRNAFDELTSPAKDIGDMETEVFERLKFSYTRLKDQNLQNCFLYLALYPEDDQIWKEELIKYWIAEGFIEKESKQKMFDKGFAILDKLINVCLMEEIDEYGWVKMHDLIRDMALKIAGPRFLVRAGERFVKTSDEDWSKDLERASFLDSHIEVLPHRSPNCPRLATLLLKECRYVEIADSFFTHMRSLRVLDLSYSDIKYLPTSICELESLHVLLLMGCQLLVEVASLKKMKALRELDLHETGITEVPQGIEELVSLQTLDLSHTGIAEVPQGIEELVNLQTLDLSDTRIKEVPQGIEKLVSLQTLDLCWTDYLNVFPSGKLSKLSQLQFLRIDYSGVLISADELTGLRKLRTLCVNFCNLQELGTYLQFQQQFQKLEKYKLLVGFDDFDEDDFDDDIFNEVRINNREGSGYVVNALMLPSNVETFKIDACHDLISLSDISSLRNAKDLRVCWVEDCSQIESIFSSSSLEHSHIPHISLEELTLDDLPKLRVIFGGVAPPSGVYCRLRILHIVNCPNLKNIFSARLSLNFSNLKVISVSRCEYLEYIIEGETSDGDHRNEPSAVVTLPKLLSLSMRSLPSLKSIYEGTIICGSLQSIYVDKCPMLRRLPCLHGDESQASPPPTLNSIQGEEEWWESLEWDEPQARICLQPFFKKGY